MLRLPLLCAVAVLALASCSRAPSTQGRVAVRVNGEAISVPEFQMVLGQASQAAQKPAPAAVMESLIDRKLFAQKAVALKYDREPVVAMLLEQARENVLAQAYVANLAGWSRADDDAVRAFYDKHRDLFQKRRVYRVIELAVAVTPERAAELERRAMRAHDLYAVVAWLKAEKLPYNLSAAAKPSEQLAPVLLSRLQAMREGEISVLESSGGASVLQLLQCDPAPLAREAAAPIIERALRARKLAQVAESEQKYLRSKASIQYVVALGGHEAEPPKPVPTMTTAIVLP